MRKLILGLILLLIAGGCSGKDSAEADSAYLAQVYERYPGLKEKKFERETVSRIVDGDTFETASGQKIRLIGVNTPEITNGKSEPYGKEAKAFSQSRLEGKKVYLFRDTGSTDKYGRLLRYLFVDGEPVMFNETLIAEGYANPMTVPPNVMYADSFVMLERKARGGNKGLWGDAGGNSAAAAAAGSGGGGQGTAENVSCPSPSIKGNINAKGEKIYHMPGGRYYNQTVAEQMFCTEQEAADAGFRKSGQ